VLSGKEEKVVAIPGTEFELPALLFAGDMYLITTDAGLLCEYLDLSGPLSIGFQGRSISCFGAIG
jgi:hypothetical protein